MRSKRFSPGGCVRLALVLSLILTTAGLAATFTSYNGKFHFTYPDTWEQIDYQTADFYIRQATGAVDYEAVFAAKDSPAVFEGVYVIMTLDTTGELTPQQIDSAVGVVRESFDRELRELPLDSFVGGLTEEIVAYDSTNKILAALSDVSEEGSAPRKNILVQKFYDRGMANFYFYSPDSLLTESLGSLTEMLASFSTDMTQRATEPVKIADLDSEDSFDSTRNVIMWGGLIVILICILMVRVRQRRRK